MLKKIIPLALILSFNFIPTHLFAHIPFSNQNNSSTITMNTNANYQPNNWLKLNCTSNGHASIIKYYTTYRNDGSDSILAQIWKGENSTDTKGKAMYRDVDWQSIAYSPNPNPFPCNPLMMRTKHSPTLIAYIQTKSLTVTCSGTDNKIKTRECGNKSQSNDKSQCNSKNRIDNKSRSDSKKRSDGKIRHDSNIGIQPIEKDIQ